jgi:hypothetical protein
VRAPTATLYRRWVAACTAGELLGFGGIPVLGAALALALTEGLDAGARSIALYVVAVAGGLGEGAVLAWFQLRVLGPLLPRLPRRRWLWATALAAAFAWACGMLAPLLDDLVGLAAPAQAAIWIPASIAILLSIGGAQAWVLRGIVDGPQRWLGANVIAWLAGLPWTFVLPALLPASAPMAVWISTFVVAGILMGVTVGLVTGVAVTRMRAVSPGRSQSAR